MANIIKKLSDWLNKHDQNIDRFKKPVPIDTVAKELNIPSDLIKSYFQNNRYELVYHIWEHKYRKRISRSKPYCLRLNGANTVGLDWEDSIIGSAEDYFQNLGFQTKREIGTEKDLLKLIDEPDLSKLASGKNLRDLWALRKNGKNIELYIIEAKGKESYEFDYYCFTNDLTKRK
ncbi:MAG: hypothetical protein JRI44_06730 [Deltaproteobacteria bacterium]|nr:hypothetical protein [Deltaproteobacteria bacterium]